MLSRTVWDSPSSSNCLHGESDGSVAVVTKESIVTYSPRFYGNVDFGTSSIVLTKKVVVDIANVPRPANIIDWFREFRGSSGDYKQLCFQQVQHCPNSLQKGQAPLLGALLTNGSLLLFQRDLPSFGSFDHELYLIKMSGYSLLLDFATTYSLWCLEKTISDHIGSFALHADSNAASIVIAVGGGVHLSLWAVTVRNNQLECQELAFTAVTVLSAHDEISALHMAAGERDSELRIMVGTSCGQVHQFQVSQLSRIFLGSSQSVGSLVTSFRECAGGVMEVVCGNKIHLFSDNGSHIMKNFRYPLSGWTQLDRDGQTVELCSTIDGSYHTWSRDDSSAANALGPSVSSRDVAVACGQPADPLIESRAEDKTGLYGLVSDPLGLILVSAAKLNPVHDNSRETQLNKGVTRSRIQVKWTVSPLVDESCTSTVTGIEKLLTSVLSKHSQLASKQGNGGVSLSGVAMLFCLLFSKMVGKDKTSFAWNPRDEPSVSSTSSSNTPGKRSKGRNGSSGGQAAADSDTSDSEEEEEEAAMPVPVAKKARSSQSGASSTTASVAVKMDVDAVSLTQQEELRRALSKVSSGQRSAVEETLQRLMHAATSISTGINGDSGAFFGVCSSGVASGNSNLYSLPSGLLLLRRKRTLWQLIHLVIVALHNSCNLPLSDAWKSVSRALKQSVVLAECILQLNSAIDHTQLKRIAILKDLQSNSTSAELSGLCATATNRVIEWNRTNNGNHDTALVDQCFICGASVAFDADTFDMIQCTSCGVQSERCCHSFQSIYQPNVQHILLRCSCCKSVMIQGADNSMCTYCSVTMQAFV